jgi:hypothetical protein
MTAGAAAIAAPLLSGCEQISDAPQFRFFLEFGRLASLRGQRLLLARQPLAREYAIADISPDFPPNGTAMPAVPLYRQMMMRGFAPQADRHRRRSERLQFLRECC